MGDNNAPESVSSTANEPKKKKSLTCQHSESGLWRAEVWLQKSTKTTLAAVFVMGVEKQVKATCPS